MIGYDDLLSGDWIPPLLMTPRCSGDHEALPSEHRDHLIRG